MMRAVQFVEKRVKPHVVFRAVGDNLGVLVKNQLLDCMDFPIGHGESSFWLKYLIALFYLAKTQRSIYHISKLEKVRRLVAIIKVLYV